MEIQQDNLRRQTSAANANLQTSESTTGGISLAAPTYQLASGAGAGAANNATSTTVGAQNQLSAETSGATWDGPTNSRIGGIHPNIQNHAYTFINRAQSELGIKLRVTSGMRTFQEQDELYAKGRTAGGSIVTKARGGQSYHNYGLAIDVVEITNAGQANWNCDWNAIGALGQSIGWEWGGSWNGFVDKPHFQMAFGLSTSQLRTMYTANGGNFVSLDGRPVPEVQETTQPGQTTTPGGQTTTSPGGQTVTPGATALSGSVGQGGQNIYDDVKLVQSMLNSSGASLVIDGDCGPLTIAAINAYQMSQFGWKDGRVDVNGKTWKALESNAAPQPLIYTVKRGDNLTKIAKQFNTTVSQILSANPQIRDANAISIGLKVTIPSANTSVTPAPTQGNQNPTQQSGGTGGTTPTDEGGGGNIIYGSQVTTEFAQKVILISNELGINPNYLMAAMAFETGGSFAPDQLNGAGSGATGLIQFMPRTAIGLGTTTADLAKMTAIQQLDYVKAYFMPYAGKLSSLEDIYMAILWPRAIGKDNSYVLWSRGTRAYTQNRGLDTNNDGSVTKGEAAGKVREKYEAGLQDVVEVGGTTTTETTTPAPTTGGGITENGENGGGETTTETQTPTTSGGSAPSSANFSISEFNCKDGTPVPQEFYANIQELMNNLEVLRSELGGNSIRINSGYRSPAYNAQVGGASNSQHKLGKAADIVVTNFTPGQVHSTIARLIQEGKMKQGGLGKYNTFTHYDVRGSQARW